MAVLELGQPSGTQLTVQAAKLGLTALGMNMHGGEPEMCRGCWSVFRTWMLTRKHASLFGVLVLLPPPESLLLSPPPPMGEGAGVGTTLGRRGRGGLGLQVDRRWKLHPGLQMEVEAHRSCFLLLDVYQERGEPGG